jgi:hypothetical protein
MAKYERRFTQLRLIRKISFAFFIAHNHFSVKTWLQELQSSTSSAMTGAVVRYLSAELKDAGVHVPPKDEPLDRAQEAIFRK